MPLDQLALQCAACLHEYPRHPCPACQELLRRALCDGNDAAWDTVVLHLWPFVLRWLYAALPDSAPDVIAVLAYRALWQFRSHYADHPQLAANFPTFAMLMQDLRRCTAQVSTLP
jgi:hypothetical protein